MAVRDHITSFRFSADHSVVAGNLSCFLYSVGNLLAGFHFVQATPGVAPLVSCIQGYFFSLLASICIKLHFNVCRAFSVLVISIFPCLYYADAGLSGLVLVDDGGS